MNKTNSNNCILIIHKNNHATATSLAHEICTWLFSKGHDAIVIPAVLAHEYIHSAPSFIIVLGGDGSIIEVARQFIGQAIPLMGINFGRVGFLANVSVENWQECIQNHLDKKSLISKQMALKWQIMRDTTVLHSGYAINDIVINRGILSRIITFKLHTDQYEVCSLRADGLIIASPVGTTGYAVSAGGPLIHPSMNAIVIASICPFLCNFPPLVLPHTMVVKVSILSPSSETYITIDGQKALPLATSDFVKVEGIESGIYFIKNSKTNYFSRLKARGFISEPRDHSLPCPEIKK